jgi:hypothetical protein
MSTCRYLSCFIIFSCGITHAEIKISQDEARYIGQKIWNNECGGKKEGLTSWNKGEAFASMGIGHFIWYPEGKKGVFKETFPSLIVFLEKNGKKMPEGILSKGSKACPWKSREDFFNNFNTKPMHDLRNFLAETVELQTTFIIQNFNKAFGFIIRSIPESQRAKINQQFKRMAASPGGFYPLIDYVNFKGDGTAPQEEYHGKRWGLLQVLDTMQGTASGREALQEFSDCARKVLDIRIAHAPVGTNEERWQEGWHNRVKTYVQEYKR